MSPEPHERLESLVQGAVDRLAEDAGRLWDYTASPRWILADADVWWLTEPVDGATESGALWRMPPDRAMGVANTSVRWQDRMWAMVDCVDSPATVRELLHEAFHAFWQPGAWDWVTPVDDGDDSLAMPEARAALRVELRAWAYGLGSGDRANLADANAVRRWRLGMLAAPERSRQNWLDLWEGLAEYSAWRWTGTADADVIELAQNGPQASSWHRSFCYTTGPVLGWALDQLHPGWRSDLPGAGSMTALLDQATGPSPYSLESLLDQLGYDEILTAEVVARTERAQDDDLVRQRFSCLVWFPLRGSIQFDPREVRHWDLGTFYRTLSVRTEEVQLTATEGAIVTSDWKWIGLPAPKRPEADAGVITGSGWQLTLLNPLLAQQISWGTAPPT